MSTVAICVLLVSCILEPVIFATSCDKKNDSEGAIGYELLETRLEGLESIILQLSDQMKDLGGKMDQLLKFHDSKEQRAIVPEPEKSNDSAEFSNDPCKTTNKSGLYQLMALPDKTSKSVYCEAETFGGGWIVIQQRLDGSVVFDRTWTDYRTGFGTVGNGTEFWLGLELIHKLVSSGGYELAVELNDHVGKYGFARFSDFEIAGEDEKYKLVKVGVFHGSIGDKMTYSLGRGFSTSDSDNDSWSDGSCAKLYSGGWWYGHCAYSFLNGLFSKDRSTGHGIAWAPWTEAARYSRMMIRRKS